MIRTLKSGEYRLYSRKVDPDTRKRRNPAYSICAPRRESTSVMCNISSANGAVEPAISEAQETRPKRNAIQDLYMRFR